MSPHTLLVVENHYLGAVLERYQFDTFYHEHPRTYSANSFYHISKSLNKALLDIQFPSRYGGNIRVFIGSAEYFSTQRISHIPAALNSESNFLQLLTTLASAIDSWKVTKSQVIGDLVSEYGPLRAKAFPGRAAILVKLLNLSSSQVSRCYEKHGSLKIGFGIPGSDIPILDDADFDYSDSSPIINLAWHISSEISNYMNQKGFKGQILDILSPIDFT
jgi:hypothetical protein